MTQNTPEVRRSRGVYLLPNLFTTAALFCGFYAIIAALHGRFEPAAVAVFIAMVLDGLDGRDRGFLGRVSPWRQRPYAGMV